MTKYKVKCIKGFRTPIEFVANDIELREIYRKQSMGILTIISITKQK